MKRVKLVVAYDGTNYCGWQIQNNGVTIEEVLNKALSELLREPIAVIGASRTDSGVHALGNVAVFDTENRMASDKICFALNQRLPEDIRIQHSEEVPLDYHPRKQNCVKTYEYKILNRRIDMPVNRLYSYFCYVPLDVELMRRAAARLVGEHDFRSFCTVRSQAEETVRTIYSLDIQKDGDVIIIRICGSGFLYNMVRIIAGTLMKVGMEVYPPEHVEEILEARDRRAAGPTALAKGLTLVSLEYETEQRPVIENENKVWKYRLIQKEIEPRKKAYLIVDRCREEELDRFLIRNIHQAVRNGARSVYICMKQGDGTIAEKDYGYYPVRHVYDILRMEMAVIGGVKFQDPAVGLISVDEDGAALFRELHREIFLSVSNSETLTEQDVQELRSKPDYMAAFLKAGDHIFGIAGLQLSCDMVSVDFLGILPSCQGKGMGCMALDRILEYARTAGKDRLSLTVCTDNRNALHLYESFGFHRVECVSRWYLAEDNRK